MVCKNCKAPLDEDSRFCGACGAKVEPETEHSAAPPKDGDSPFASRPIPANVPDLDPTAWIVLSVLEIIFCVPTIPGIVGLIFGILADSCRKNSDWEGVRSNLKVCRIAVLIGLGITLVGLFFFVIGGFLLGFLL